MFEQLTAEASFTRIEEGVRRFWRLHGVPATFYAAHRSGLTRALHHQPLVALGEDARSRIRLLATADLLARYFAMRGDAVQSHGGWLCHGLSVEHVIERSLGPDVDGYDLARFNDACRQAVLEAVRRGEAEAERVGIWPCPGSTFYSLDPAAIGKVWNVLHLLFQEGALKEEHRVVPFCPRCATPLASSEAGDLVLAAKRQSVWFRLPWGGEPNTYLLAWADEPWMLVGMVALAVHPATSFALVEMPAQQGAPPTRLILAEGAIRRSLAEGARLIRRLSARSLRDARYRPPFTFLPADEGSGRVLLSEAAPKDIGTGLWPVMPAFEPRSLLIAQQHNLPIPDLLDDWGKLDDRALSWRGLSPLDVEPLLIEDLEARGLMFGRKESGRVHSQCRYCRTAIFPLARRVWIVDGGGEPWVVGRDRAWGVPLPVWVCQRCGHHNSVAGLDDLAQRANVPVGQVDPHRPAIDRVVLPCESCGGTMRRISEVLDAGFEAATLSWAALRNSSATRDASPDARPGLVVGLVDEQSGWLEDLSAMAALRDDAALWDHVLTLPCSWEGREAELATSAERSGPGDALRWEALSGADIGQAESDLLRPLWRWVSSISAPEVPADSKETRGVEIDGAVAELFDRWLAARAYETVGAVGQALESCKVDRASRALSAFLSDLIDWYSPVRPGAGAEVVETLTRLLAPFLPHLAEAIHRLRGGRTAESVHLAGWPTPDPAWEDHTLLARMARVKRLAALGETALDEADLRPDQWTGQAVAGFLIDDHGELTALAAFERVLAHALGAERVRIQPGAASHIRYGLSLRSGRRVERTISVAEIETALANLDASHAARLVADLREGLSVRLLVSGQSVALLPEDVTVTVYAQPGWIAAADAELVIWLQVEPDVASTLA